MSKWSTKFKEWLGKPLPDDYMVFDLETTGFSTKDDIPVDIGWCVARNRKPVAYGNFALNWFKYPDLVNPKWLRKQLLKVEEGMAERGSPWLYTEQYLQTKGKDPLWVLLRFNQLLWMNREACGAFAGHNAWNFDCPMLEETLKDFLPKDVEPFSFSEHEVYDTAGMARAIMLNEEPYPDDKSLRMYFKRVLRMYAPGVRYNLTACAEKYGLLEGHVDEGEKFHEAAYDAFISHLLFEKVREQ